jgi:putative NADH-flavin reductase
MLLKLIFHDPMRRLLLLYSLYVAAVAAVMGRRGIWARKPARAAGSGRTIRKVLVIGATGGIGQQLVRQALELGYETTAFVRDPAKVTITHPQLRVARGDVLDLASVEAAMEGQDAVVSALGQRQLFVPSNMQTEGMRNILQAMETRGVRRIVCVTALGLGDSVGKLGLATTLLVFPFILAIIFWDKSRQEQLIATSKLDWTVVRPPVLTDGPKTGTYRHGHDVGSYIVTSRLSRADVADFVLKQLTSDQYLRMAPGIVP